MAKSPARLDREIAEALAKAPVTGRRSHATMKIGDAVQFRWEPGTGGVVRSLLGHGAEGRSWALVATPRGEREVPTDALVPVRTEHEQRVRRSVEKK